MNYAIENELYQKSTVNYTNASYLINPEFSFSDGLFSGAKTENGKVTYDKATWTYQTDADGNILKDYTLQDPNCVFQLMKKHYSRYDVDMVCNITGCPKEKFWK